MECDSILFVLLDIEYRYDLPEKHLLTDASYSLQLNIINFDTPTIPFDCINSRFGKHLKSNDCQSIVQSTDTEFSHTCL